MSLAKRTKIAIDESRMLMLGAQIFIGFQFQAPFQNAFEHLNSNEKTIAVLVLAILIIVTGLLIAPGARHRIVEQGAATVELNAFITRLASLTLLQLAAVLGFDLYIAGASIGGPRLGWPLGLGGFLLACVLWYGPVVVARQHVDDAGDGEMKPSTQEKIEFVLTEARVVLPGAQALLGFQLAIILTTGFEELPNALKLWHSAAIGLIALATVILIAPAAYHRIVYNGTNAAGFYPVASRLLLAATVFLALGLSADALVVIEKITGSRAWAQAFALVSALLLIAMWHAWPWWMRRSFRVQHGP